MKFLFLSLLSVVPLFGNCYEINDPQAHWIDDWILGLFQNNTTQILYEKGDDLNSLVIIAENVKVTKQKVNLDEKNKYILFCNDHFYEIGKLKHCSLCPCQSE